MWKPHLGVGEQQAKQLDGGSELESCLQGLQPENLSRTELLQSSFCHITKHGLLLWSSNTCRSEDDHGKNQYGRKPPPTWRLFSWRYISKWVAHIAFTQTHYVIDAYTVIERFHLHLWTNFGNRQSWQVTDMIQVFKFWQISTNNFCLSNPKRPKSQWKIRT